MRNLRTEQKIMSNWKSDSSEPLVSIVCTTYNHEIFIEDALEGFLIQEADFPFEILIHDDASTDKTADIIRQYEGQYPRIVKPIYQTENQYSKGRKPGRINKERAKGTYIAFCEGDDYWTDPKKLQIQVDFLEANPDYVISGHDAFIVDEDGNIIEDSKIPTKYKRDCSGEDLIFCRSFIPNLSKLYRNYVKHFPVEIKFVLNGDTFLTSLIGHYGNYKYHDDIKPACYRRHSGGIWSGLDAEGKSDAQINTMFWIYKYYKRIGDQKCAIALWKKFEDTIAPRLSKRVLIREMIIRLPFGKQIDYIIWRVLSSLGFGKKPPK